jgi:hypothetical protein
MSRRPNRQLVAAVAGFAAVALVVAIARRSAPAPSEPSHLEGWSSA